MPLATQKLRILFKMHIEPLLDKENVDNKMMNIDNQKPLQNPAERLQDFRQLSIYLEKVIQEHIQQLENDFRDLPLIGDYLRTVTEGFTDLDRLLCSSKTLLDSLDKSSEQILLQTVIPEQIIPDRTANQSNANAATSANANAATSPTIQTILTEHIKKHYTKTLVPLLNIMAKLENDYISFATQIISKKQDMLNQLQILTQKLIMDERLTQNNLLIYNKDRRLQIISEKLKLFELKRKILQLGLQHDQLNLYYFSHDHPNELREVKQKADSLSQVLQQEWAIMGENL